MRSAAAILVVLLAIAVVSATLAFVQRGRAVRERDRADQQARLADARRLATAAVSGARDDLSRSALLAIEANRLVDNAGTRGALLSVAEDAAPVREIIHGSWNTAAVAPDGRSVATVGAQGISLVDLETRATRSISRRDFNDVRGATFSPDGKLLALGGDDVEILNARTGQAARPPLPFRYRAGAARTLIQNVRFSPDGKSIVALTGLGFGVVWSLASGHELGRFKTFLGGSLDDAVFSPDGKWLGVSGNGDVPLDAHSLQPRFDVAPPYTEELDVAFSPDGSRLTAATRVASASGGSGIVIRDAATGAVLAPSILVGSGFVSRLAYSPDGNTIAGASSDGTITEWDARSGAVRRDALLGPTRVPVAMSFTRDGRLVVLTTSEVVVLDPDARLASEIVAPDSAAFILWLAVSPDGRSLAAADGIGHVRVWDIASGRLERSIAAATATNGGVASLAYRPGTDTFVVAAGDGTLTDWDQTTGRRIHGPIRLTAPSLGSLTPGRGVLGVAFDESGDTLVASTGDGTVAVVDPSSWTLRRRFRLIDDASSFPALAISPDGRTVMLGGPRAVVVAGIDGSDRRRLEVGPVVVTSLALQPGGRLLAAGLADGRILVADAKTARLRSTLVSNHGEVDLVAFESTGTTLAAGGNDGTVTLWTVGDAQPLGPALTSSQKNGVFGLAFSPHDTALFAGGEEGSIVRYDLDSARWTDRLCSVIGRNLTSTERHAYLADPTAGRRTCPNWPTEP